MSDVGVKITSQSLMVKILLQTRLPKVLLNDVYVGYISEMKPAGNAVSKTYI